LGMKAITGYGSHCTEAMKVGFAQNSHQYATVGPRSFGARVGQPSLAGLLRYASRSRGSRLIAKRSDGAWLHGIKHGGFERGRTNPALRENVAPLETLCAASLRMEERAGQCS
jgi:hypothetical protein